jgi:hypothetical protein
VFEHLELKCNQCDCELGVVLGATYKPTYWCRKIQPRDFSGIKNSDRIFEAENWPALFSRPEFGEKETINTSDNSGPVGTGDFWEV